MANKPSADVPEWMRKLAGSHPFGRDDRRGTANLVDAAARARGAGCIRTGESVSLARPLGGHDYNSSAERPGFWHETWYRSDADGTGWADRPVDGADIDAALAAAGIVVEAGDALCLDMGRDRFESARGHPLGGPETDQDAGGGLSGDGARWVAEHAVSVLAWDMLDSSEANRTHGSAHVLTWAIGLLLLDNCDFAALRAAHGPGTKVVGALVISLLAVPGSNGVNLNPLILS